MNFEQACQDVLAFRDERNWKQFHNPKDLDIPTTIGRKMKTNRQKYPADKAWDTAAKYDEL